MEKIVLDADCAQCAGLCCIALPFDRSASFAIDKPGGVPCPHLNGLSNCAIHAERVQRGFRGCVEFDCHGAGQRVTRELLDGRTGCLTDPSRLKTVSRAFISVLRAHECLLLLRQVRRLQLSAPDLARAERLQDDIMRAGFSEARIATARRETLEFLVKLKGYLGAEGNGGK